LSVVRRAQVLVKLSKKNDRTAGGLFVASGAGETDELSSEGIVVAAGPGRIHEDTGTLLPLKLSAGDLVLLSEYAGERVDYNGEQHIILSADAILGRFEGGVPSAAAFQPHQDRVLVLLAEQATETASGIALAVQDEEPPAQGEVSAVGEGRTSSKGETLPVRIAVGESVLYAQRSGSDAELEGRKYKVVRESDCLAKW